MMTSKINEANTDIKEDFFRGLHNGIPICLGYVSVGFTFGMMCTENGLSFLVAVLISLTNLTSAGQFAGTALIISGGSLLEIGITTFVINLRYMLMSLSISQKVDVALSIPKRMLMSFGITDEIFGVSMQTKGNISWVEVLAVGAFGKWQQVRRFRASAGTKSQPLKSGTNLKVGKSPLIGIRKKYKV